MNKYLLPLLLLFLVQLSYGYTIVKEISFYISSSSISGYILISSNTSVNLSKIIPKDCNFTKLISVTNLSIKNNIINLNSSESFIVKINCKPKKISDNKYILYINSDSQSYNGSSLFIYLLEDTKLINISPKFYISNNTIYNNNITNLNFILTYETYNSNSNTIPFSTILIVVNIVYIIILFYVLKSVASRLKKEEKYGLKYTTKILDSCNTKLERKIIKFIIKNDGACYQFEIYKNLKIDKSTVSKILKRLEERGLIIREEGERGILVKLNIDFNK